jgi:prepilin-type N-terminal cleavage/methylation domain-containing protein
MRNTSYKLQVTSYKKKAFTLIEMLVTLGIITALSSMILVYSRKSESVSNLIREGDHMAFELRRAQNQAMLMLQQNSDGDEKICGWGIYIETNLPQEQFLLFKDLCLPDESRGNEKYNDGEKVESISLLKGVEISGSNVSSITFIPPEPRVKFEPDLGNDNAYIEIQLKNQPGTYYEIQVSEAGQISKKLKEI